MTDEFSANKIELKEGLLTLLSGKPIILILQGMQWPWQIKQLYDDDERFVVIEYVETAGDPSAYQREQPQRPSKGPQRVVDNDNWQRERDWEADEGKRPLKCIRHNLRVTGCPSAPAGLIVCNECLKVPEEEKKQASRIDQILQKVKSMFSRMV
jgi:hypothetical protein